MNIRRQRMRCLVASGKTANEIQKTTPGSATSHPAGCSPDVLSLLKTSSGGTKCAHNKMVEEGATTKVQPEELKKNGYAMIKGNPCRLLEVTQLPKATANGNKRVQLIGLNVREANPPNDDQWRLAALINLCCCIDRYTRAPSGVHREKVR